MNSNSSPSAPFLPKWLIKRRSSLCVQPSKTLPIRPSKTSIGVSKSPSIRLFRPAFELLSPSDPEPETYKNRCRQTKPAAFKFALTADDSDEHDEHYAIDEVIDETEADLLQCPNENEAANISSENESSYLRVGRISGPESSRCALTLTRNAAAASAFQTGLRRESRRGSMPDILLHGINNKENSLIFNGSERPNPRNAFRLSKLPRALFSK